MKKLLSGNEAVARGAYEAGIEIAAAYPGTPSTEILENIALYNEIYAEWSVNEKIAFEVAFGGAVGGKRALAAMKHVGVNVASDALMTSSYTGINAGFILVSSDDPGMHSSQNEQDNRYYAKFAKIPMLEPSSAQEAKDFVQIALEMSEEYDTPVLFRMTTRICHGKGIVQLQEREVPDQQKYKKDPQKYVMIPGHARKRHVVVEARMNQLENLSENSPLNYIEKGDSDVGVISAGVAYQYAKEVFPDATFFKIGMSYPLPLSKLKAFCERHKTVYVIEELEPFIEDHLKALGINVLGKEIFPRLGEYSPELIKACIDSTLNESLDADIEMPNRPPVMCAGCPHRPVFHVLKKLRTIISGDIGCYTLSTLPPLNTMDTVLCMGASIGVAQGLIRSIESKKKDRIVSILGDSTFIHSGIPSLVNAVYNKANITVVILDNRITAMTGHQENPGSGKTLQGATVGPFNFEAVASAIGVKYVRTIDPIETELAEKVLAEAIDFVGPSVVIAKRPCVLVDRAQFPGQMKVVEANCTECKKCLGMGCPALSFRDGKIYIDETMCFGCSLCQQICPQDAIIRNSHE